ncbi:RNase P subunit p30-domain-containing protein [Phycomyces nitens]|nr:RNase P subunit p30-domain-containing protein [Phycomyces nitens]
MLYDLNIPCPEQRDHKTIERLLLILSRFSQLDNSTIALNHVMDGYDPTKFKRIEPIVFDQVKYPVNQLSRLTIDTNTLVPNDAIERAREHYDLVAIRTSAPEVFEQACTCLGVDVIALDCSQRLPFHIDPLLVQTAVNRDIYFEICYSPGIRDSTARGYLLQIAKQWANYTGKHHLLLSSEALSVSEIRAPGDVYYFAKSIGLPNDKAKCMTMHDLGVWIQSRRINCYNK